MKNKNALHLVVFLICGISLIVNAILIGHFINLAETKRLDSAEIITYKYYLRIIELQNSNKINDNDFFFSKRLYEDYGPIVRLEGVISKRSYGSEVDIIVAVRRSKKVVQERVVVLERHGYMKFLSADENTD